MASASEVNWSGRRRTREVDEGKPPCQVFARDAPGPQVTEFKLDSQAEGRPCTRPERWAFRFSLSVRGSCQVWTEMDPRPAHGFGISSVMGLQVVESGVAL